MSKIAAESGRKCSFVEDSGRKPPANSARRRKRPKGAGNVLFVEDSGRSRRKIPLVEESGRNLPQMFVRWRQRPNAARSVRASKIAAESRRKLSFVEDSGRNVPQMLCRISMLERFIGRLRTMLFSNCCGRFVRLLWTVTKIWIISRLATPWFPPFWSFKSHLIHFHC